MNISVWFSRFVVVYVLSCGLAEAKDEIPPVIGHTSNSVAKLLGKDFRVFGREEPLVYVAKDKDFKIETITVGFIKGVCRYVNYELLDPPNDERLDALLRDVFPDWGWEIDKKSPWTQAFARCWVTKKRDHFATFNDRKRGGLLLAHEMIRGQSRMGLAIFSKEYSDAISRRVKKSEEKGGKDKRTD